MCDSKPQGYDFTKIRLEFAKREAEATYKFDGVLQVIKTRTLKRIEATKMACPFCRQGLINDMMGYSSQNPQGAGPSNIAGLGLAQQHFIAALGRVF